MGRFIVQYKILLNKGLADYNAAKILYHEFSSGKTELDLDIVIFHLQQCVEKLLKAVLSFEGINFTKTHDLELLFSQLEDIGISFSIDKDLIFELNDFAV